tara:strand:+ start:1562 stop:4414 length:2853 start_codon:yes stop_codon:yes gene_type:complete
MAEGSSRFSALSKRLKQEGESKLDSLYTQLLSQPVTTVILMMILSAWFANVGMDFKDQIEDDVEIFLPENAESSELLLEVRQEWSTDIAIIYIQTRNAEDPNTFGNETSNISNVDIMHEISWIEGDDEGESWGPGILNRGIDWDKTDRGKNDGVLWIISFPQIIKEINSSNGRFQNAMCNNPGNTSTAGLIDCEAIDSVTSGGDGLYAIPDDQATIDRMVFEANGGFDSLVKDTNDDGVWDTTAVIIGMTHDMSVTGKWADYKEWFAHVEELIDLDNRPEPYQDTIMIQTGLSKVLEDISGAIYLDLLDMLPLSLFLTTLIIMMLHRSWKVVVITGTPIVMALAMTFGSAVMLKMTLTPMIVATFPILIGLGVDYALHMVNRIEEVRRKRVDEAVEENDRRRRKGLVTNEIPDMWDLEFYKSCVMEMTRTTGVAVIISAATTVIGFSVLIAPNIVSIIPIRSVGLTLVTGILSTLLFSLILVPTLAWLLRYSKRTNPPMWGGISKVPIKSYAVILIVAFSITAYGIINMDEMSKPITGSSEAPEGIDSLEALATYSEVFGGGQTSLFIFDASSHDNQEDQKIRDLRVLDAMDALEQRIDEVDYTNTTSLVTFLKAVPASLTEPNTNVSLYEGSLWDLLHHKCWEWDGSESVDSAQDLAFCGLLLAMEAANPGSREGLRADMVNVAYDTLSKEVQWMLTNDRGDKALVYVTQPYMNLNNASILRDEIDVMLNEPMEEPGIDTSKLTGGLPVSLEINEGIHDTQSLTTILTLIILTIVMMIVFRSPRLGFYTMLPVAVVIIWQPLLMRSGDVNVNIFTAMIGTIVFGIGVDDAIHVMHRIQEEGETAIGMSRAVERTGQTIFETTITTVAGLGAGLAIFGAVSFPGLENFFVLMMLLIIFAFVTSVFLLPAALTADNIVRNKIKKKSGFIDYGDGIVLTDENMKAMEAELLD